MSSKAKSISWDSPFINIKNFVCQEQEEYRRECENRLRREGKLPSTKAPPPPQPEKKSTKSDPIPKLGKRCTRYGTKLVVTYNLWFFWFFYTVLHHCFICRPFDSTVSEDAGIERKTFPTLAVRSNHAAISRPLLGCEDDLDQIDSVESLALTKNINNDCDCISSPCCRSSTYT